MFKNIPPDMLFRSLAAFAAVVLMVAALTFVVVGMIEHDPAKGLFCSAVLTSGSIMSALFAVFS